MPSKIGNIVFYADDAQRLSAFWAEALHYDLQAFDGDLRDMMLASGLTDHDLGKRGLVTPPPGTDGPRLFFHHADAPKAARNRIHLDVQAVPGREPTHEELDAERDRLVALGATVVRLVDQDWGAFHEHYYQLRDPEGNEFCLQ